MARKTDYAKQKGRGKDKFVPLSHKLLDSPAWKDLSLRARDLFVRLCRKYNGKNNGDLSLPMSELRAEGELKSPAALKAALDELWSHGFIEKTRQGSFGSQRVCNLWAVTIWPINDIPEKGVRATGVASNAWKGWSPDTPAPDYQEKFPKTQAARKEISEKARLNKIRVPPTYLSGTYNEAGSKDFHGHH